MAALAPSSCSSAASRCTARSSLPLLLPPCSSHLLQRSSVCLPFASLSSGLGRGGRRSRDWPAQEKQGLQILAAAAATSETAAVETETELDSSVSAVKNFLEELKAVGRVRIIVNTGVGVLESVTTLDKLFYHKMAGRGEYANLMNKEENVDFHLLLDKVKCAKFAKGKSMRGDIPTYSVRFLDDEDKAAALILVMWKPGTDGEYDPGQVEAFEALLAKYTDTLSFKS